MDLFSWSLRIGRIFDVEIRVHVLFLIWAGYSLVAAGHAWRDEAWFMGMLFGIVLVHEFGHCFGARSVGGDAREIMLWPLGGLAFAHAPMTPWAQFVTVACGPLVNLIFCVLSGAILVGMAGTLAVLPLHPMAWPNLHLLAGAPEWVLYVVIFYAVNFFLLGFNLLPIYPLDGGQLLQTILWPFLGLQRSMYLACQIGLVGAVLLGLLGLQQGGMMLFIAIFGGMTCWQRMQQLKYGMFVDERIRYAPTRVQRPARPSWWQRTFGSARRRPSSPIENPNPGGWEQKLDAERRLEEELDRILKKVHNRGIQSLNYIERQTLERATRERQAREREFENQTRL